MLKGMTMTVWPEQVERYTVLKEKQTPHFKSYEQPGNIKLHSISKINQSRSNQFTKQILDTIYFSLKM